ncbi:hypothetical protein [Microbulbifer pacificus]|uniref:hypothetical protein n=1 Tax=Microbulbifer pacificus TaxID=407164 RepID=UPI000CF3F294|nr:hypothetical protein [Microbulbifer pacificus]
MEKIIHTRFAALFISLCTTLLLALPGTAAESLQTQLQQCGQFSDDGKRLACYDQITGNLRQHAEQQFGQEQRQVVEDAPESITATIASAEQGAFGKYTFTLDNGQVWQQVESSSRAIWRGGEQVAVERGVFGSFFMRKVTGGRSLRVKRIQ